MELLLDTHALLWFLKGSSELSAPARVAIEDPTNEVFVSVVCLWEMAIKHAIGKLELDGGYRRYVDEEIRPRPFAPLDFSAKHVDALSDLGFPVPEHKDPFDRALIEQARAENLTLVSKEASFQAYPVRLLW